MDGKHQDLSSVDFDDGLISIMVKDHLRTTKKTFISACDNTCSKCGRELRRYSQAGLVTMTCVDRVQHPSDRGVSCCLQLQHCFGFASRFAANPKRAATTPSATTRLCFWLGLACLCCIVPSFTTDPTIYRRHKMEDTVRTANSRILHVHAKWLY